MMHICFVRLHDVIAISMSLAESDRWRWVGASKECEQHGHVCMGLAVKSPWLEWVGHFSWFKCNRPRKQSLTLYSLQFQGSRPIFLLKWVSIAQMFWSNTRLLPILSKLQERHIVYCEPPLTTLGRDTTNLWFTVWLLEWKIYSHSPLRNYTALSETIQTTV